MTARPVRVLVADDHQVVREGVCRLLDATQDIVVVGDVSDGLQAVERAEAVGPDVVVMDVQMPSLSGIEATRRLAVSRPDIQVLVLSMYDDAMTVDRALRAGARGFALKDAGVETLREAIHAVAAGAVWLSPRVSDYVLQGYLNAEDAPADPLTSREREIVQRIAEGYTSREIADALGVSPKTIQNQRSIVLDKLGVRTTAGLVRWAIRHGLVPERPVNTGD
jgi:DNA-binding NarL/FixJ family response regulator